MRCKELPVFVFPSVCIRYSVTFYSRISFIRRNLFNCIGVFSFTWSTLVRGKKHFLHWLSFPTMITLVLSSRYCCQFVCLNWPLKRHAKWILLTVYCLVAWDNSFIQRFKLLLDTRVVIVILFRWKRNWSVYFALSTKVIRCNFRYEL